MPKIKKADLSKDSLDIVQEKIGQLKKLFPEVLSEGKIDVEKLRLTLGENIVLEDERYNLNWAGKTEAFNALQTPTTATLASYSDEGINFDKTGNVFIEGENLEVLKVLQKSYYGKIKMIYIDPPYNTGNDNFIYPDKFQESKEEYLKRIEEKDEEGYLLKEGLFRKNSKENGHYHSNWLSMMYPRLFLARNLLRDDGVIFISIDDNEVHNLRLLMNEIFGEENFVDTVCWKKKYGGGAKEKYLVSVHEYVLMYAKSKVDLPEIMVEFDENKARKFYKHKDENFETLGYYRTHPLEAVKSFDIRENLRFPVIALDGTEVWPKRQWRWSHKRFKEALSKNEVIFSKNKDGEWVISSKQYINEKTGVRRKTKAQSLIDDVFTQDGTKEIFDIFGDAKIFPFPKPIRLLKRLTEIGGLLYNDDIILDFFTGSAATAHAVLDLNKDGGNRKFICVQLPEKCDKNSEAYKAGYKTIAEIGKERIRRVIKKIKKEQKEKADLFSKDKPEQDLGFKVFKLKNSNFKIWRGDVIDNQKDLEKQMDMLKDPVKPEAQEKNMLWELLLKSGYDLNTPIEEKKIGKNLFYIIAKGETVIMLSPQNEKSISEIIKIKPQKVICLDNIFEGDDQLKTNTALQMKDAKIEFRTV